MEPVSIFDCRIVDLLELTEDSNKAHVLITEIDKYVQNIPRFWNCLSAKEQEQAKKYCTSLLRDRYIISHGILRYILSYYAKELPQNLEFTHNKYGKPFLKKTNIQFNMSHSHNIVCYAIAFNYKVGIDIEYHNDVLNVMELLELVFTPQEVRLFNTFACETKMKTFYSHWTKKESLVKAIGKGLAYPINTIETLNLLSEDKMSVISTDSGTKESLYSYEFGRKIPPSYSGTIATDHKINKIVYVEATNQQGIFDTVRFECLN